MKKPQSISNLEELGRIQLSKNFFLREFLYSEISQIEGIANIPDDRDLAIAAGKNLCENVLEPIQNALGRISIRSAYRSCEVNKKGSEKKYSCAKNEDNYAKHIWDRRDVNGYMGATACIIVNSFMPYYEKTGDWTALAWLICDRVPGYADMTFFPKYAAFNISWHENPNYPKFISSYVKNPHTGKAGYLTKQGMSNFNLTHQEFYQNFLSELEN